MCTVTFIARRDGYALGMNRDEKLSRVQGLPPAKHAIDGRVAIFPSEPSGGTWIGVNDARVAFALINWYSVTGRVSRDSISRGAVPRAVLAFDESLVVERHLARYPLHRTNPFRLIGIFPDSHAVLEWRWDLSSLQRIEHRWQTNIWISSGYDEPGAEIARRRAFNAAKGGEAVQDLRWLRRLHSSHEPAPNAYSICMHRDEARTVSYTELSVTRSTVRVGHVSDGLCQRRSAIEVAASLHFAEIVQGDSANRIA